MGKNFKCQKVYLFMFYISKITTSNVYKLFQKKNGLLNVNIFVCVDYWDTGEVFFFDSSEMGDLNLRCFHKKQ